jgi:transposase-like protein
VTARRYTAEQRAEALELYAELGAPETARRLGIPKPTVASWARRAGVHTDAADPSRARARTEAARARWEEVSEDRRQQLAGRLVEEVHRLADQLQEPTTYHHVVTLSGGKDAPATERVVEVHVSHPVAKDQRDRAQAMAALMDKLQLLSGGATERLDDTGGLDLEAEYRQHQEREAELRHLRAVVNGDST